MFLPALAFAGLAGCLDFRPSATDMTEWPGSLLPALIQNQSSTTDSGTGSGGATVVYMYTDSVPVGGGQGNRAATNAICSTMQTTNFAALSCTKHMAVLSYSGGDDLVNAPANEGLPSGVPVRSATENLVAADWGTFLTGPDNSLQTAGVSTGAPVPYYWTSSLAGGGYDGTHNCADNTNSTMPVTGAQAAVITTAGTHIAFANNQPCDGSMNQAFLVCVCWN
ncbi:MAG: hypothetical protein NXI24_07055 [bacterium]|nr:hypothetical protein [bacterium]